jgi:hypothetical protein
MLERKLAENAATRLSPRRVDALLAFWRDPARLAETPVHEFMGALAS